jgi:hypothetical protein
MSSLPILADTPTTKLIASQGSWDSLFFGLVFFIVVCGIAVSFAKKSSSKQHGTYVSRKGALAACCAFNFLVGALVVQVSATAVYLALFNSMMGSLAIGSFLLVWGILTLSGGIAAYFGRSNLSMGSVALSVIAIILGLTNSFGFNEFSAVASSSISMDILPISLVSILGIISLSASAGAVALYIPKKLSITISPLELSTTVGESEKITSSAKGGYHNYLYQWYLNDKPISNSQIAYSESKGHSESVYTFIPTERGSYDIYVVLTDRSQSTLRGKSETNVTSKHVVITVTPAPLTQVVINASPTTIDIGQSSVIRLIKPVSGGVKPYSYQWFEEDASLLTSDRVIAIMEATKEEYRFTTTGNTRVGTKNFRLQVTDTLGTVVTSNMVKVKIYPIPTIKIGANSTSVDAYKQLVVTVSASGGTEPFSYQWYLHNKKVAQGSDATYNFNSEVVGQHHIYVILSDSASPSVSVKSEVFVIKVVPVRLAPPIIYANPIVVGVGQPVLLTQLKPPIGGIAPYQYQWFETDSNGSFVPIYGATKEGYIYTGEESAISRPKSHRLQVTDLEGSVVVSNEVTAKVNPLLKITEFTPRFGAITVGSSQTFTVTAIGGTGEYRYEWYLNGSRIYNNSNTYIFSARTTGLFKISVTVFDGAEKAAKVESEARYVANFILTQTVGDINNWRAGRDFDKVLGFDILEFIENTSSEKDVSFQLEKIRDYRIVWCGQQNWARNYTNAAIAEAYQALKIGRRNIVYVKRIAPRIFDEWKLFDLPNLKSENLRNKRTEYINALLLTTEREDTENPWVNMNAQELNNKVKEEILKQNGLSIGIYLASDEINREGDAIFFLKDAIKRYRNVEDKLEQANNWLGVALCNLHRTREALPYLEEALRLNENETNFKNLIGALKGLEEWNRAKTVCERYGDKFKLKTAIDIHNYAFILASVAVQNFNSNTGLYYGGGEYARQLCLNELQGALFVAEKGVEFANEAVRQNNNEENRIALETCKKLVRDLQEMISKIQSSQ